MLVYFIIVKWRNSIISINTIKYSGRKETRNTGGGGEKRKKKAVCL